jgi:glutaminyl-tRNA synthetase
VIKNESGQIKEIHCTYDPETRSGTGTSTKKVKGTIHWVSAKHAVEAEVRLYDRLFSVPNPDGNKEKSYLDFMNPDSLEILSNALVEPFMKDAKPQDRVQFERHGYFCVDTKYTTDKKLVFNRTVTLKDSWTGKQG